MNKIPSSKNESNPEIIVPDDFPRPDVAGAVAGYQPKLLLVKHGGKFYPPGGTPPERFERWDICEDLAQQLVLKCRECKSGKRSHMTELQILEQYLRRLLKARWGSDNEMRWVIRRTAALLEWPAPDGATATVSTGKQQCDQ